MQIRIKVFFAFKMFLSSLKNDLGCSPRILEPDFFPIPDPGLKKAPDPGSATLVKFVQ
jgi:hypothetical protein